MLASNYERVHANAHLLAKFERLKHPYIQESIQQWGRLRLRDISVAFWHCDPHSQYQDHSNLTHNGSHLEDKLPAAKETRPERTPERVLQDVIWQAATEHCVQHCVQGDFFACRVEGETQLERLADRVQVLLSQVPRAALQLAIDDYVSCVAPCTPTEGLTSVHIGDDDVDMDSRGRGECTCRWPESAVLVPPGRAS